MNIFNGKNPAPRIKLNKFDLGHERKFSCNMSQLIPILVQDILPGDTFRTNTEIFMRFAPMLAPIMHRVNVFTHYFFVPNRLVWDEWEDFITGGKNGDLNPIHPYMEISNSAPVYGEFYKGSLADYLGIPAVPDDIATVAYPLRFSSLPFRAYQLIYNEYYRDQNLSDPIPIPKTSGPDAVVAPFNLTTLRNRAWEKDYFTTALPWAQRGGEVGIPLEMKKAILEDGSPVAGTDTVAYNATGDLVGLSAGDLIKLQGDGTINDLRKAFKLQEWLERSARGGARYIEQILAHFGVRSSDARLQRPEYLGGGMQKVNISEVLSTYDNTAGDLPQGTMSGHGISSGRAHGFKRTFEEHGYVIGIMSVMPKAAYQQGLPRHYSKFDRFEHYWPEFANLGEQAVINKELYWDGAQNIDETNGTFGYQSRYAEYKFKESSVHGDFRDNLAFWHMGRIFDTLPALNEDFVMANNEEMDRIFAVVNPDEHKLWVQIYNSVDALRPMPYHGTPRI